MKWRNFLIKNHTNLNIFTATGKYMLFCTKTCFARRFFFFKFSIYLLFMTHSQVKIFFKKQARHQLVNTAKFFHFVLKCGLARREDPKSFQTNRSSHHICFMKILKRKLDFYSGQMVYKTTTSVCNVSFCFARKVEENVQKRSIWKKLLLNVMRIFWRSNIFWSIENFTGL